MDLKDKEHEAVKKLAQKVFLSSTVAHFSGMRADVLSEKLAHKPFSAGTRSLTLTTTYAVS
jgi:hypothetical protein